MIGLRLNIIDLGPLYRPRSRREGHYLLRSFDWLILGDDEGSFPVTVLTGCFPVMITSASSLYNQPILFKAPSYNGLQRIFVPALPSPEAGDGSPPSP